MNNLNRQWLILIIIMFLSVVAAVGWEIYAIYIYESRSEFRDVEAPLPSNTLISDSIKDHFEEIAN